MIPPGPQDRKGCLPSRANFAAQNTFPGDGTLKRVAALRGVRFDPGRVGRLDHVLAPPYDVVTRQHVEAYLARSPYNVLQLDLGIADPSDPVPGRWDEVGRRFREWLASGVLRADERPSVYVLRHVYRLPDGTPGTLTAALAGLRVGPGASRAAMGHERTVAAVRGDRLEQLRRCRAQFSPILALVSDPDRRVQRALEEAASAPPSLQAEAPTGGELAVWVHPADSPPGRGVLDALAAALDRSPAVIADGHHRFEAASQYAEEQAHLPHGSGGACGDGVFALTGLASLEGGGLSILPVHRVVGPAGAATAEALRMALYEHLIPLSDVEVPPPLRPAFEQAARDPLQAARAVAAIREALGRPVFAVWWGPGRLEWLAVPSKATHRSGAAGPEYPGVAGDITILHRGPLATWKPAVQGADGGGVREPARWIRYTPDAREAAGAVDRGEAAAAILMAAVRLSEVQDVAMAGKKMPEKSTYFYPKLISGLVLQDLLLPVQAWPPDAR